MTCNYNESEEDRYTNYWIAQVAIHFRFGLVDWISEAFPVVKVNTKCPEIIWKINRNKTLYKNRSTNGFKGS